MATTESSLMKEYSSATGGWRSYLTYTTSTTDTAVTITCVGGVRSDYWSFAITSGITSTLSCTGQSSVSGSGGLSSNWSSDVYNQLVSKTYTIQRTSSAKTVTISCSTTNASGYINGTATASATVSVFLISFFFISFSPFTLCLLRHYMMFFDLKYFSFQQTNYQSAQ